MTAHTAQFARVLEASERDMLATAFGASAEAALLTGLADGWDAFDKIMMAGAEKALAEIRGDAK